jgi:hypothetical protein
MELTSKKKPKQINKGKLQEIKIFGTNPIAVFQIETFSYQ